MKRPKKPTKMTEGSRESDEQRRRAHAKIGPGDEVSPLYDFSDGVRGKYVERLAAARRNLIVVLDPDVSKAFPTREAVNEALRREMKRKKAR
jgi:hypothetical protein